jgi:hypothetical protein
MAEEETNEMREIWLDLTDAVQELKSDVKSNRRASRHAKDLERIVNELGQLLTQLGAKKKGFLR